MASTSNNTPGTSSSSTGNSNNSNNNSSSGDSKDNRWYFTAEQLANSPSRRQGIDADQELSFRQLTAYLIQEMGQRLQVSQLCINTAIVYMHRFYAFHSFTHFHRNGIAAAALFLAAKVEEQPRKLEHVIKVAHMCLNQEAPHPSSDLYAEQAQDLVFNENVLLQTLGFDVAIDHPHTHVVKTCHLVKACKDLAQTSYFLASNSLHLTSMCLQYRPTVVACFCIYLACKWSRWEIPQSTEGRHWFHYVDKSVTMDLLKQLTDEFIAIYEKSPARLKSKLNSIKALAQGARIPEPSRSIPEPSNASSSQPVNQVEPTRRPESYSSHHRSHHTSSSHQQVSSHHHHGKLNEVGEHKSSSSHKQPYPPTAAHSNRPRPERSQDSQQYGNLPHGGGGSKQQLPLPPQSTSSRNPSSSGNNSSSNRPQHSIPPLVGSSSTSSSSISSVQRISAHGGHDPNLYHKNRSSIPPQINPSLPSSHKSVAKIQEPIRPPPLMKDPSLSSSLSRSMDPSKLTSKHSNNSVYASQNSGNVGIDMTRNVLQTQQQQQQQSQQQRPYLPQSSSQPANYSQSVLNRTSSSSSRYDQQQQLSVQQPHLSQLQNQKQLNESSFGIINTKSLIDENSKSGGVGGDQMEICSPPKSSYSQSSIVSSQQQQQQQQQQQYQQQQHVQQYHQISQQQHQQLSSSGGGHQKTSSIFSPEQNEKTHSQLQSQQPATLVNTNNPNNNNNNVTKLGFKSNRDSPKKTERERKSEMPKKEKIRPPDMMQMQGAPPQMKFTQQQQQQMDKRSDIKPLISQDPILQTSSLSSLPNLVTPISNFVDFKSQQHLQHQQQQQQQQQTHALNFSNTKRRASRDNVIKFSEETSIKDAKLRKIEPQSPPLSLHNPKSTTIIDQKSQSSLLSSSSSSSSHMFYNMHEQSSINNEKTAMKSYPTTLNGTSIETNPDLVSSLLKESLCNESQKFTTPLNIKQEPKENISENCLLDTQSIIMETLPEQLLQTDVPVEQQQQLLQQQQQHKQRNNTDNKLPMMTNITTTTSSVAAPSEIQPQQQQQQPQIPIPLTNDEYIKSKSEKKKKKDKHKHKEKDKSKDKEERKKHKKDKDRHKERHHQESVPTATIEQNPVKIKISKDKLNLSASSAASTDNMTSSNPSTTTGFKIKIPKDRIKGELSNFQIEDISMKNPSSSSSSSASHHHHQSSTPSSLKIKISKDKIEFNHQQQELSHLSSSSSGGHHHGSSHHHGTNSSSSSSNKRKDRDRDRDREKKKSSNSSGDYGKQNGSGSGTKESNNTSSGIASGNFSSTKNQLQTTKIQQYNGNNVSMSQLFGESYDDDEDNSDNYESDYIDSKDN